MKQEFTITAYTENHVGLMGRIAIVFSRRKINIETMNVCPAEVEGISRFTILINESRDVVEKVVKQIEKQVEVLKVFFNTDEEIVWQEMAMYKVPTKVIAEQVKVERLLRQYGANTVVIRHDYTVFETTGHREEIDALVAALQPWGLIEFVRSARIAVIKASEGIHKAVMEFEAAKPSEPAVENEFLDQRDGVFTM